jgi:hypothetical protein
LPRLHSCFKVKAPLTRVVAPPFLTVSGQDPQAAWRSKPSFYAVSTEDRTINPDLERFMAKRVGTHHNGHPRHRVVPLIRPSYRRICEGESSTEKLNTLSS